MKKFKLNIFDNCDIFLIENLKNGKIKLNTSKKIINELSKELIIYKGNNKIELLEILISKFSKLKFPLFKLLEKYEK